MFLILCILPLKIAKAHNPTWWARKRHPNIYQCKSYSPIGCLVLIIRAQAQQLDLLCLSRGKFDTDRRKYNVTGEADIGMTPPQTKESWQLAEVGRGKEWILPYREAGTGNTNN